MKNLFSFNSGDVDLLAFNPSGEIEIVTSLSPESTELFPDLDKINNIYSLTDVSDFKKKLILMRTQLSYSMTEFNNFRPTPKSVKINKKVSYIDFEITDYAQTKIVQDLWRPYYDNNREKILSTGYRNLPFLAKSFGANLLIKTADNHIVITKRSSRTRNFGGLLHVSTSEGSSILDTFGQQVDVKNIFIRSAREEIGVDLSPQEISINAFYLLLNTYQYGLAGFADLTNHGITASEIKELASSASDSWESEELKLYPLGSIPALLEQENKFISFGYLTLLLNLHNIDPKLTPLQSRLLDKHRVRSFNKLT